MILPLVNIDCGDILVGYYNKHVNDDHFVKWISQREEGFTRACNMYYVKCHITLSRKLLFNLISFII